MARGQGLAPEQLNPFLDVLAALCDAHGITLGSLDELAAQAAGEPESVRDRRNYPAGMDRDDGDCECFDPAHYVTVSPGTLLADRIHRDTDLALDFADTEGHWPCAVIEDAIGRRYQAHVYAVCRRFLYDGHRPAAPRERVIVSTCATCEYAASRPPIATMWMPLYCRLGRGSGTEALDNDPTVPFEWAIHLVSRHDTYARHETRAWMAISDHEARVCNAQVAVLGGKAVRRAEPADRRRAGLGPRGARARLGACRSAHLRENAGRRRSARTTDDRRARSLRAPTGPSTPRADRGR